MSDNIKLQVGEIELEKNIWGIGSERYHDINIIDCSGIYEFGGARV